MLRSATAADFPLVRSLAGRPDYAPFITDQDEGALARCLTAPDCRFLIWEPDGTPAGFAIFSDIGDPSGRVELMRLALVEAGRGLGGRFVWLLLDHAVQDLGAQRVWLDCSGENLRGQRVYERAGFTLEGRFRRHHRVPATGRLVDILFYGLLREEWEALEPVPAQA